MPGAAVGEGVDLQATLARLKDYETVIDTMNCGLVAEDLEQRVVFVNQRMLEWLGYERHEVEGQPIEMLVPPELRQLARDDMEAAARDDLRARLIAVRRKDSTTFPVVTIPQRFLDNKGKFEGFFSIVVDLGAVMTAKPIGSAVGFDLRTHLARIALELQSISLCVSEAGGAVPVIPLEHPQLRDLSPRESEVLAMLMAGTRVPAIAKRLHISQHTVRNHLKSMYRKLEVGTQSDLIERVRSLASEREESAAHAGG